jgi:hypothetical protein
MARITITDLIETMRKAASNPEAHARAQVSYFSELRPDSVLTHCGTACCVAGDLLLRAHKHLPEEKLKEMIDHVDRQFTPWKWVTQELSLTRLEATLAFNASTHYRIHLMLADILEKGLRLPDVCEIAISSYSDYTEFDAAYLGRDFDNPLNLNEFLGWIRSIAE